MKKLMSASRFGQRKTFVPDHSARSGFEYLHFRVHQSFKDRPPFRYSNIPA